MKPNPPFDQHIDALDEQRKQLQNKDSKVLPMVVILPVLVSIICFLFSPTVSFFVAVLSLISAYGIHKLLITDPFNELKHQVREHLLKEFMQVYHPNIDYHYQPITDRVKDIIKATELVSCDSYHEEDVISGTASNVNFYLSEIKLSQSSGQGNSVVFQGILFKIKLPGRNFPPAQIQSKPRLLKKMFGNFNKLKEYGFWIDTYHPKEAGRELGPFFPFIRHLIQQQKDIRIHTNGEEITILMKSDMKFLDDPKPRLGRTFKSEAYYEKIGQQINSLLFIVEAFAGKLDEEAVMERLELKELEYRKLGLSDEEGFLT